MNTKRLKGEIVAVYGTQLAFGKDLGWSKNKVTRMVRGQYLPDIEEVAQIKRLLGLNTQQIEAIFFNV